MKKILLLISLFIASPSSANAQNADVEGALVAAKWSGGCGVIKQMFQFQESTQMPGGEEFIMRFLNTELARLDFSHDEYSQTCVKSNELYQNMLKLNNENGQE